MTETNEFLVYLLSGAEEVENFLWKKNTKKHNPSRKTSSYWGWPAQDLWMHRGFHSGWPAQLCAGVTCDCTATPPPHPKGWLRHMARHGDGAQTSQVPVWLHLDNRNTFWLPDFCICQHNPNLPPQMWCDHLHLWPHSRNTASLI